MKAVRIHKFGSPDVMQIEEVQRPAPAPDEILVKIYASGINPMDWRIRKGGEVADRLNINPHCRVCTLNLLKIDRILLKFIVIKGMCYLLLSET
jgi:hypothetical protein